MSAFINFHNNWLTIKYLKVSSGDCVTIYLVVRWVNYNKVTLVNISIFKWKLRQLIEIHQIVKTGILVIQYLSCKDVSLTTSSISQVFKLKLLNRLELFPQASTISQNPTANKLSPEFVSFKFLENTVRSRIHVSNE